MARQASYNIIQKYKIYAIFHGETDQIYIDISATMDMKSVYTQHYTMRNKETKGLFKEYRETIHCPQIYVLQTVNCDFTEAKSRQAAFIRYFLECGYFSLNHDHMDTEDEYVEEFYNEISQRSVMDYLSEENHILLNYGRHRGENKNKYDEGKKQICIRVSEEEYEIIKKQAENCDRSLTAYIKEVAMQGRIFRIDYDAIRDHTKEITRTKQLINAVVELFAKVPDIYESDILRIVELQKSVDESEKKLLYDFLKHTEKVRKTIAKELRKL